MGIWTVEQNKKAARCKTSANKDIIFIQFILEFKTIIPIAIGIVRIK